MPESIHGTMLDGQCNTNTLSKIVEILTVFSCDFCISMASRIQCLFTNSEKPIVPLKVQETLEKLWKTLSLFLFD